MNDGSKSANQEQRYAHADTKRKQKNKSKKFVAKCRYNAE